MATKRRASNGGVPDGPIKGQKRRRVSAYVPDTDETPEKTSQIGLDLLDQIKQATDKHGHPIATEFLQLPDRDSNPDYYAAIRLPMSLDMVEKKLRNIEYPQLTPIESDLRRMVSNAKFYNEKGSQLFSNAERIRKIVASAMPKLNPAYKDPNYVPFSTPIPEGEEDEQASLEEPVIEDLPTDNIKDEQESREERSETVKRTPTAGPDNERDQNTDLSFEGDTFQGALEKIIIEMIRLKDASGEEIFYPFLRLPDRTLYKDYYEIITHPVSLRAMLKLVRGTDRRKTSTKSNPFRTWQAFEDEVSYLWRNAREFNEDGSEIVAISERLEAHFLRRLAEAKKVVPEPPPISNDVGAPRIKLKIGGTDTPESTPHKLTLRLPGKAGDNQQNMEALQGGVTVDSDALKRQQDLVKAGSNGTDAPIQPTPTRSLRDRTGSAARTTSSGAPSQGPGGRTSSLGVSPMPASQGSRIETPQLEAIDVNRESERLRKQFQMPISTSPKIGGAIKPPTPEGVARPVDDTDHNQLSASRSRLPLSESEWAAMQEMNNEAYGEGLISNVTVTTHSALDLSHNFHLEIPSSPILGRQSVTINLPSAYHLISISPTVASNSQRRQTQHYVTVGDQKIPPTATMMRSIEFTRFVYDVHLRTGVTKIEISMMAPKGEGENRKFALCEQVTIFANLLRT